jgi:hypothetical protein
VEPLGQTGRRNGSRFVMAGLTFETNYDGSQDEGDKSNDAVLDEFFAPFRGEAPFAGLNTQARLIAINEGRLRDFLADHRVDYPALDNAVSRFLDVLDGDSNSDPVEGLLVVNLNWRAIVAGEESIFSRQLRKLVDPRFWIACQDCAYQDRCFLKANADRIGDPNAGNGIVERLRKLFEVVYLRRRLHLTMRDTRSALSYILLRDHSCDDVAQLLDGEIPPVDYLPYFYYNAVAAPDEPAVLIDQPGVKGRDRREPTDRVIRLLAQIDPSLVANPDDDRRLYFASQESAGASGVFGSGTDSYDRTLLAQVRQTLVAEDADPLARQTPALLTRWLRFHAMLRRKSYFERLDGGWERMLPYPHLHEFLKLTGSLDRAEDQETLKSNIGFAISTAEGMRREDYARGNVILRAGTNPKARLHSFRRFPIADFQLQVPRLGALAPYIEYAPDRIFFEHVRAPVRLTISLDLFELLQQIANGAVPTPADVQGYFLNLTIFKNALAHLPYREVLLTENSQQFYRVWADEQNVIHMTELAEGRTGLWQSN